MTRCRVTAGALVQTIDVLGDDRVQPAGAFKIDQGAMTVIG